MALPFGNGKFLLLVDLAATLESETSILGVSMHLHITNMSFRTGHDYFTQAVPKNAAVSIEKG